LRNNKILYNLIKDVMLTLRDGGAIYTLSAQRGTEVAYNYIKHVARNNGLYPDMGSSYMHWHHNVVSDVPRFLHMHTSSIKNDTIENNWYDRDDMLLRGSNCVVRNNTLISNDNWPPEARQIMENAGIQETNTVSVPVISPASGYLFSPAQITISCATEGARIHYTRDGTDPTESSPLYSSPFTLSDASTIKARGYKRGKDPSSIAVEQFRAPRAPDAPANVETGLSFLYYEGAWTSLPDFSALSAAKSCTVANFDLSVRSRDDNFGIVYTGYIEVPQSGMYTFTTRSDDGSALYLGSVKVVDNDGIHSTRNASGSVGLLAGKHAFRVEFLEFEGQQLLEVSWKGPGVTDGPIPPDALFCIPRETAILKSTPASIPSILTAMRNGALCIAIRGTRQHAVSVFDIRGRTVRHFEGSGTAVYTLKKDAVTAGSYIIKSTFAGRVTSRRYLIH
jgi:hypothetical protein